MVIEMLYIKQTWNVANNMKCNPCYICKEMFLNLGGGFGELFGIEKLPILAATTGFVFYCHI